MFDLIEKHGMMIKGKIVKPGKEEATGQTS